MKRQIIRALTFITLLSPSFGMEEANGPNSNQSGSFPSQLGHFLRERVAGLYYTTSVVGYDSIGEHTHDFLHQKLQEGWVEAEFVNYRQDLPVRGNDDFKAYADILQNLHKLGSWNPEHSVDDFMPIHHRIVYKYLYKENQGSVSIVMLDNIPTIEFAPNNHQTKLTREQLDRDFDIFQKHVNELYEKMRSIRDRRLEITLNDQKETLKDDLRNLEEQLAELEAQKDLENLKISQIIKGMKDHIIVPNSRNWLDFTKDEFHSNNVGDCLIGILDKFKNMPLQIHGLAYSEESSSSNLATRAISLLSGGSSSIIGHYTYVQMHIDAARQGMNVTLFDPTFDPKQPHLQAMFRSSDPLPQQSERFFQKIAASTNLKLAHSYHYKGDQWVNFHDCNRFSTIYLLSALKERDPLSLSNYDIYQGLKHIEESGYEKMHQRVTLLHAKANVQTWFAWCVGGPRRAFCDLLLRTLFSGTQEDSQDMASSSFSQSDNDQDSSDGEQN